MVIAEPLTAFPRVKNLLARFFALTSPAFVISKIPTSLVAPKRFLKADVSQKNDSDGVANVIGGDIADSPYNTSLPSKTPESSSSESEISAFEPLGGMVYIPDSTDTDSSKANLNALGQQHQ